LVFLQDEKNLYYLNSSIYFIRNIVTSVLAWRPAAFGKKRFASGVQV